jgi:hypothetical protein
MGQKPFVEAAPRWVSRNPDDAVKHLYSMGGACQRGHIPFYRSTETCAARTGIAHQIQILHRASGVTDLQFDTIAIRSVY